MMCGGVHEIKEADGTVQEVLNGVIKDFEEKNGQKYPEYTATHYTSQVVAGTNFFVKVHVGEEKFFHMRIFRPLPGQGELSLHSYQEGKTREDNIGFF